jgi:hypothetical protein
VIVKYYIEEGRAPVFTQKFVDEGQKAKDEEPVNEVFYTEGEPELREARLLIAKYSLPRGQKRVDDARRKRAEVDRMLE